MNGYICFYKEKRLEVYAESTIAAIAKANEQFKAKKTYNISCMLAEKDGKPYIHTAT